ncbi:MAG: hypothetical protein ACKODX_07220, partial [Gemmata sp.]
VAATSGGDMASFGADKGGCTGHVAGCHGSSCHGGGLFGIRDGGGLFSKHKDKAGCTGHAPAAPAAGCTGHAPAGCSGHTTGCHGSSCHGGGFIGSRIGGGLFGKHKSGCTGCTGW